MILTPKIHYSCHTPLIPHNMPPHLTRAWACRCRKAGHWARTAGTTASWSPSKSLGCSGHQSRTQSPFQCVPCGPPTNNLSIETLVVWFNWLFHLSVLRQLNLRIASATTMTLLFNTCRCQDFENIHLLSCPRFLADQNNSIGDLVTDSLTHWLRVLLLLTYKERP